MDFPCSLVSVPSNPETLQFDGSVRGRTSGRSLKETTCLGLRVTTFVSTLVVSTPWTRDFPLIRYSLNFVGDLGNLVVKVPILEWDVDSRTHVSLIPINDVVTNVLFMKDVTFCCLYR